MIIWGFLSSLGISKEPYYHCLEYDAKSVRLDPPIPFDRVYLAVPKKIDNLHVLYLFLTNKEGTIIELLQSLICRKESGGGYLCGGECDAGDIRLDASFNLHHLAQNPLAIDVWNSRYEEVERTGFASSGSNPVTTAHPAKCPPVVVTLFNPERDGLHAEIEHSYVCYEKKIGGKYHGCDLSTLPCEKIGKKRFGHYKNETATQAALDRCVQSKPIK